MFDVSFSGVSSSNRRLILGAGLLLTTLLPTSESFANALESYVRKQDASCAWKRTEQKRIRDATVTHLEFTSQTWRGHLWRHDLLVLRPTSVRRADTAMLFITGDTYTAPNQLETDRFHEVAQRAGAVVAILNKVPNQPLYDGRKEDALIAFTFDQYLKTSDPTWPLLFPMVKSALRAMDALQSFAEQEFDQRIERFVVSGESKRGWTSWLTGAVDTCVVAIAPMAIDMLKMKGSSTGPKRCTVSRVLKSVTIPISTCTGSWMIRRCKHCGRGSIPTATVGALRCPSSCCWGLMILIGSSTRYVTTGAICQSQSSSSKRRTPGTIWREDMTPGKR